MDLDLLVNFRMRCLELASKLPTATSEEAVETAARSYFDFLTSIIPVPITPSANRMDDEIPF